MLHFMYLQQASRSATRDPTPREFGLRLLAPIACLLLFAFIAASGHMTALHAGEPVPVGKTTSMQLANGLQIVVVEDHRLPVATHMVWYKVGAIDDPQGSSGLAHLLEHLMFKSFDAEADETFAQTMSRLGAIDNALTAHDYTYFFQRVAKEHLPKVMAIEARRMSGLTLTKEQVTTERDVVREERRSVVESDPLKLLTEQVQATLYQNHNYGRSPIGWSHEIANLQQKDAVDFYEAYYSPGNAIVVIAGDVTPQEVRQLAAETYGPVPAGNAASRLRLREPEPIAARRVELIDRRVPRPTLFRYYLTPSYNTASPGQAESLEVLMAILGGGETSRMHRVLVNEQNAALAVGARYFGKGRDSGHLALFGLVGQNNKMEKFDDALDALLADVVENGVTEEELTRAKAAIEARLVFEKDNQMKLATSIAEALVVGRSIDDITALPDRLAAVTRADVEKAAREFLVARRSVTGLMASPPRPKGTAQ